MKAYDRMVQSNGYNLITFYDGGSFSSQNPIAREILTGTDLNKKGNRSDPTPFFYTYQNLECRVGSAESIRVNGLNQIYKAGSRGRQSGYVTLYRPTMDYAETTQTCLNKIYDQLRDHANVIVDAAEGAATLRMLRATLNFKKVFKNFLLGSGALRPSRGKRLAMDRNGDLYFTNKPIRFERGTNQPSAAQIRLDMLTSKWLEYRYGWIPLISSIYDAAKAIHTREIERIVTVKGRSGRKKLYRSSVTGLGTYASPHVQEITDYGYRSEVKLRFKLPDEDWTTIANWTSLNPLSIAWELLPLSFVADWLLNIGEVLEHIENYWLFRNKFLDGWQSDSAYANMYRVTSGSTRRSLIYLSSGQPVAGQTGSESCSFLDRNQFREHRRFLHGTLPYSNQVRLRVKLGVKRQLDAVSLIHQLMGKRMR